MLSGVDLSLKKKKKKHQNGEGHPVSIGCSLYLLPMKLRPPGDPVCAGLDFSLGSYFSQVPRDSQILSHGSSPPPPVPRPPDPTSVLQHRRPTT